jgi:NAD(P)H-dependent FMN reductase
MKIVLINGSMNENSNTELVLKKISLLLKELGAEPELHSVRNLDLKLYDPNNYFEECDKLFFIKQAEGIIFASPEYHGSYTGALKNLIDYLDSRYLKGKNVGIVSTSGSSRCGINTLNSLRILLRNLHANVLINQLTVCEEELEEFLGDQTVMAAKNMVIELVQNIELIKGKNNVEIH